MNHTSQLSKIAQSPAATDLSGGKASEVLSTVRRNSLAAEDAVDPHLNLFFEVVSARALSTVRRNSLAAEDPVRFQLDLPFDVVARRGSGTGGLPVSSIRSDD